MEGGRKKGLKVLRANRQGEGLRDTEKKVKSRVALSTVHATFMPHFISESRNGNLAGIMTVISSLSRALKPASS
jgi:hypothetical protein